jgi:hypothetical protein
MTRFRPTVETLDARALPSAVLADVPAAPTSAAAAHLADEPDQSLNFSKITFKTIEAGSKVTMQDFHFTVTVSKASPKL